MKKAEPKKLESLNDSLLVPITDEEASLIWGGIKFLPSYTAEGAHVDYVIAPATPATNP